MGAISRVSRYARLAWKATSAGHHAGPSFLVLFVNSICNLKCQHCFYWRHINQPDDLTFEEIIRLADDMGKLEILNLSGGEPFLRKEVGEICRYFVRHNGVKEIYVPTNGWYTAKTLAAVRTALLEPSLRLFACELSIDGTEQYHDYLRGVNGTFRHALETYDALAELQKDEPRLRIHAVSTASAENMDEIRKLSRFLYERCPAMDHHNLAIIRGDRRNPALLAPDLTAYRQLYAEIRELWASREADRYGASVEPMLQWAKLAALENERQVVPCRAGWLNAVVYANGDVSVCEMHPPLGNLRQQSFSAIWKSPAAQELRRNIAHRQCWCTTEVFLWPSIVYQPVQLLRAMAHARRN